MHLLVWALVGAVVGGVLWPGVTGTAGGLTGAAIGVLTGLVLRSRRDLADLRAAVARLEAGLTTRASDAPTAQRAAAPAEPTPVQPVPDPWVDTREPVHTVTRAAPMPPPMPAAPVERDPPRPQRPSWLDRAVLGAKRWLTEGNVPVKIGMLVLFAGVAAFLKYASDQHLLVVPVSVRLAIVALLALGGTALGWWQRGRRRAFGLAMQGGGIGVLLMTVYAAFRLYGLLDALPTFALLVVFVLGLGVLAVLQDAMALAVLGLVAGFAAPVLVSTGQGSHVALFSYYAVLNIAILGIALYRSWRVLNLLGFIGTFAVGTTWGVLSYRPEFFASTEPFLVLFFLLYVAVPWLHVLRSPDARHVVLDGSLMFGNPIVCLLLQAALLAWRPTPLALSALCVAVLYVVIAYAVRRRPQMRLLRETWAVLAVAFATVAVPLALNARVTACVFALEGAGLVWFGFRQQRRFPRWAGLGLQVLAAGAWLLNDLFRTRVNDLPLLNAGFVGTVLLVTGAALSLWQYDRHGLERGRHRWVRAWLLAWLLMLLGAGLQLEIDHVLGDAPRMWGAWFACVLALGCTLAWASHHARTDHLRGMLRWSPAVALAVALYMAATFQAWVPYLDDGWLLIGVAIGLPLAALSMRCVVSAARPAVTAGVLWWALCLALAAQAVLVLLPPWLGAGWQLLALGLPGLLWAGIILRWPQRVTWPLHAHARTLREIIGRGSLLLSCALALVALFQSGDVRPLPFLPLLNPVDLVLVACVVLLHAGTRAFAWPAAARGWLPVAIAIAVFFMLTSMTLRTVSQWAAVPWDGRLPGNGMAQLSLTVVWSLMGVATWVTGSRRGQWTLWVAGAACMGIVLLKLLLLDRTHLGNLFGIASFIAFGVLCIVIGYIAPAPPRHVRTAEDSPDVA